MSAERSQDLTKRPEPRARRRELERDEHALDGARGLGERRLAQAIRERKSDPFALVGWLHGLPAVDRYVARLLIVRELGVERGGRVLRQAFGDAEHLGTRAASATRRPGVDPFAEYDRGRATLLVEAIVRRIARRDAGTGADAMLLVEALEPGLRPQLASALRSRRLGEGPSAPSAEQVLLKATRGRARTALAGPPVGKRAVATAPRAAVVAADRKQTGSALGADDLQVLARAEGERLPQELERRLSRLLGHDFSHVRIHTDAVAAATVERLGAKAVTVGTQIFFNSGYFAPGTPTGDRLLVHELTHVVQHDHGRLPARGEGFRVTSPTETVERDAKAAERLADRLPSPTVGAARGGRAAAPSKSEAPTLALRDEAASAQPISAPRQPPANAAPKAPAPAPTVPDVANVGRTPVDPPSAQPADALVAPGAAPLHAAPDTAPSTVSEARVTQPAPNEAHEDHVETPAEVATVAGKGIAVALPPLTLPAASPGNPYTQFAHEVDAGYAELRGRAEQTLAAVAATTHRAIDEAVKAAEAQLHALQKPAGTVDALIDKHAANSRKKIIEREAEATRQASDLHARRTTGLPELKSQMLAIARSVYNDATVWPQLAVIGKEVAEEVRERGAREVRKYQHRRDLEAKRADERAEKAGHYDTIGDEYGHVYQGALTWTQEEELSADRLRARATAVKEVAEAFAQQIAAQGAAEVGAAKARGVIADQQAIERLFARYQAEEEATYKAVQRGISETRKQAEQALDKQVVQLKKQLVAQQAKQAKEALSAIRAGAKEKHGKVDEQLALVARAVEQSLGAARGATLRQLSTFNVDGADRSDPQKATALAQVSEELKKNLGLQADDLLGKIQQQGKPLVELLKSNPLAVAKEPEPSKKGSGKKPSQGSGGGSIDDQIAAMFGALDKRFAGLFTELTHKGTDALNQIKYPDFMRLRGQLNKQIEGLPARFKAELEQTVFQRLPKLMDEAAEDAAKQVKPRWHEAAKLGIMAGGLVLAFVSGGFLIALLGGGLFALVAGGAISGMAVTALQTVANNWLDDKKLTDDLFQSVISAGIAGAVGGGLLGPAGQLLKSGALFPALGNVARIGTVATVETAGNIGAAMLGEAAVGRDPFEISAIVQNGAMSAVISLASMRVFGARVGNTLDGLGNIGVRAGERVRGALGGSSLPRGPSIAEHEQAEHRRQIEELHARRVDAVETVEVSPDHFEVKQDLRLPGPSQQPQAQQPQAQQPQAQQPQAQQPQAQQPQAQQPQAQQPQAQQPQAQQPQAQQPQAQQQQADPATAKPRVIDARGDDLAFSVVGAKPKPAAGSDFAALLDKPMAARVEEPQADAPSEAPVHRGPEGGADNLRELLTGKKDTELQKLLDKPTHQPEPEPPSDFAALLQKDFKPAERPAEPQAASPARTRPVESFSDLLKPELTPAQERAQAFRQRGGQSVANESALQGLSGKGSAADQIAQRASEIGERSTAAKAKNKAIVEGLLTDELGELGALQRRGEAMANPAKPLGSIDDYLAFSREIRLRAREQADPSSSWNGIVAEHHGPDGLAKQVANAHKALATLDQKILSRLDAQFMGQADALRALGHDRWAMSSAKSLQGAIDRLWAQSKLPQGWEGQTGKDQLAGWLGKAQADLAQSAAKAFGPDHGVRFGPKVEAPAAEISAAHDDPAFSVAKGRANDVGGVGPSAEQMAAARTAAVDVQVGPNTIKVAPGVKYEVITVQLKDGSYPALRIVPERGLSPLNDHAFAMMQNRGVEVIHLPLAGRSGFHLKQARVVSVGGDSVLTGKPSVVEAHEAGHNYQSTAPMRGEDSIFLAEMRSTSGRPMVEGGHEAYAGYMTAEEMANAGLEAAVFARKARRLSSSDPHEARAALQELATDVRLGLTKQSVEMFERAQAALAAHPEAVDFSRKTISSHVPRKGEVSVEIVEATITMDGATMTIPLVGDSYLPLVGQKDAHGALVNALKERIGLATKTSRELHGLFDKVQSIAKELSALPPEHWPTQRLNELVETSSQIQGIAKPMTHMQQNAFGHDAIEAASGGAGGPGGAPEGAVFRPQGEHFGGGATSKVYRDGEDVVKVVNKQVAADGGDLVAITDAERVWLAESGVSFTNDVHEAMPDIVPKQSLAGPGAIRQRFVTGKQLFELKSGRDPKSGPDQVARKNVKAAIAQAEEALGIPPGGYGELENGWLVKVDTNSANFRFDADGNILSWFDPVSIVPPHSRAQSAAAENAGRRAAAPATEAQPVEPPTAGLDPRERAIVDSLQVNPRSGVPRLDVNSAEILRTLAPEARVRINCRDLGYVDKEMTVDEVVALLGREVENVHVVGAVGKPGHALPPIPEQVKLEPEVVEFLAKSEPDALFSVRIDYASGHSAQLTGNVEMVNRALRDPDVVGASTTVPGWLPTPSASPAAIRRADASAQVAGDLRQKFGAGVGSTGADLGGRTIHHGTIEGFEASVLAGPKNVGKGFGGAGLYVAQGEERGLAETFAGMAQKEWRGRLRELPGGFVDGPNASQGVVLSGHLDPAKVKDMRVGTFTVDRNAFRPDLEKGVLPFNWADDPRLARLLERDFDILVIRPKGLAIDSQEFLILHQSAEPAVVWDQSMGLASREVRNLGASTAHLSARDPELLRVLEAGGDYPIESAQADANLLAGIRQATGREVALLHLEDHVSADGHRVPGGHVLRLGDAGSVDVRGARQVVAHSQPQAVPEAGASTARPSVFRTQEELRRQEFAAQAKQSGLTEAQAGQLFELAGGVKRDQVTGFERAEARVPTLERAIEWVRNNPEYTAIYVEGDIANLSGLNGALGASTANIVYRKLAQVLSQKLRAIGVDQSDFRHGGDEISSILVGKDLTIEKVQQAFAEAHAEVAAYVRETVLTGINGDPVALAGIVHPKHLGDARFNGTGLSLGAAEITGNSTAKKVFSEADRQVEADKLRKGVSSPADAPSAPEPAVKMAPGSVLEPGTLDKRVMPERAPEAADQPHAKAVGFRGEMDELRAQFVARARQLNPEITEAQAEQMFRSAGGEARDTVTGFEKGEGRVPTVVRAMEFVRAHAARGIRAFYAEIDLRNLGGLNAVFGHSGADEIFHFIAKTVHEELNAVGADLVPFRHGGDEISFVVVGENLSEAMIEAAMARAQARIREFVEKSTLKTTASGAEHPVTAIAHPKHLADTSYNGTGISHGVAEIVPPPPGRTVDDQVSSIFGQADRRVEMMKKGGGPSAPGGEREPNAATRHAVPEPSPAAASMAAAASNAGPGMLGGQRVGGVVHFGADAVEHVARAQRLGLMPQQAVRVGEVEYKVGAIFDIGGGRVAALFEVEVAGQRYLRVAYRSNSQGSWRILPARSHLKLVPGFDKPVSEHAISLPSEVDELLSANLGRGQVRRDVSEADANAIVEGAVPVNRSPEEYGRYMKSADYLGNHVREQHLLNEVPYSQRLSTKSGEDVPPPGQVQIATPGQHPDFGNLLREYRSSTSVAGEVDAYVYRSFDGSLEYVVYRDATDRIWFKSISKLDSKITPQGVRDVAIDPGALCTPIWEYRDLLPREYVGVRNSVEPNYVDAWAYVRQFPEIQAWYRATGRTMPGRRTADEAKQHAEHQPAIEAGDRSAGRGVSGQPNTYQPRAGELVTYQSKSGNFYRGRYGGLDADGNVLLDMGSGMQPLSSARLVNVRPGASVPELHAYGPDDVITLYSVRGNPRTGRIIGYTEEGNIRWQPLDGEECILRTEQINLGRVERAANLGGKP